MPPATYRTSLERRRSRFLRFRCFTNYVQVTFFRGASLGDLRPSVGLELVRKPSGLTSIVVMVNVAVVAVMAWALVQRRQRHGG